MKNKAIYPKRTFLFLTVIFVFVSFHGYSQYLPLTGGSLTGSLTINPGNQLQTPYLGFNTYFTQPSNSSNFALFPNSSTGTLDIVGVGWRFIPANNSSYQSPVVSFDASGNANIAGNTYIGRNLGVGTTTPNYTVQLGGNIWSNLGSNYTLAVAGDVAVGNATSGSQPKLTIIEGTHGTSATIQKYNGYTTISDGQGVINLSSAVGINTTNTQGYQFAVNGTAIATSMTVKAYANWPDYVFKKNYPLPSLTEVKTYIDQNHHLPEMPSEQQIAKDGLNLGEMNKLLVKKVEELTLYLIELKAAKDKEEKEQGELNKTMIQQLKKLQAQVNFLTAKK